MSSGSTTWTAGSSRRSSSSSKAGPSGSRPSPPPWARIPVRSKRCTSRFSCNAASWPARRAAAAPPEPRTSILGSLRPEPRTSKRSSTGRQSRYRTSDFNYSLPAGRIAQHPLPDRAASRLLVLDRSTGAIRHAQFRDIVELVAPEDVLVLNVSRVIPARLHGKRETGNVAELLVVRELPDGSWLAMGHPGGKLKPGRTVRFGDDSAAEIVEMLGGGLRRVKFVGALDARATLAKYGETPLPPYIRRAPVPEDRARYQTVYAAHDGSVAAPTAGLHFTAELVDRVRASGTAVATLDLHVGPGTFKPVEVDDLAGHALHAEPYAVSGVGDDHQRQTRGGRPNLGGRNDRRARARDVRRRAGRDSPWSRRDLALHLPSVPVSRRRPAAHELSPAPLDAAHAGVRGRGIRQRDAGVWGGGATGIPILFIWRCDGDCLSAELHVRIHDRSHLRRRPHGHARPAPRHDRNAGVHARRNAGDGTDALARRPKERRGAARPGEHLPPPRPSRRGRRAAARWSPPLHGVGPSAPHRLGRLPGLLTRGVSPRGRRRRRVPEPRGWEPATPHAGARDRDPMDPRRRYRDGVRSCRAGGRG